METKAITFPHTKSSDLSKPIKTYLRSIGASFKDVNDALQIYWKSDLLNCDVQQSEHITRFALWLKGSRRFLDVFHFSGKKATFSILIAEHELK